MSGTEILILCLVALVFGLFIALISQRIRLKRDIVRERKDVREHADREIQQRTEGLLKLAAVPFLWTVRTELLEGDAEQIEQYLAQYSKLAGVSGVALVDVNGNIKYSADKSWEGKAFHSLYPNVAALPQHIEIHHMARDEKLILAPVMDTSTRLGTVAILYHPREVEEI